jgi:hypothetical protein
MLKRLMTWGMMLAWGLAMTGCSRPSSLSITQIEATPPPIATATPASAAPGPTATLAPPTATREPVVEATVTAPAIATGKVVGLWNVPVGELEAVRGYGVNTVFFSTSDPQEMVNYLLTAEGLGLRVIANLVEHKDMVDQECLAALPSADRGASQKCHFDLRAFRQTLEQYQAAGLGRFADTSLYAHLLMDEPFDDSNWGGRRLTNEEIQAASEVSKQLLGENILTSINAGTVPANFPAGMVDLVTSTFYQNKEPNFGTVDDYLAFQLKNLAPARAEQPTLHYILLLPSFGGGQRNVEFPSPETMLEKALAACQNPLVDGVIWWTWKTRQWTDFSTMVSGPDGQAYVEMLEQVAQDCDQ